MDVLDADDDPLYSMKYKKHMSADIVQFVPFREFCSDPIALAKETLEEIPRQMTDHFKKKNIVPMPKSDVQRKQIKKQLSKSNSIGGQRLMDKFFMEKQEKFFERVGDMGIDLMSIKDFCEDKQMYEENAELIIDYIHEPQNYVNPLKTAANPK